MNIVTISRRFDGIGETNDIFVNRQPWVTGVGDSIIDEITQRVVRANQPATFTGRFDRS